MKNKKTDHAAGVQRVIKKYPNRRLYDTNTSTYITLAEIKQLVVNHAPFVVRDAKSGEDITRSILLHIILEEEACSTPMFTSMVLSNIIRLYGHAMQGFIGGYLEKNVETLLELQSGLGEASTGEAPEAWTRFMALQSPVLQGIMNNNLEQSRNLLGQMQEQMQKQTGQVLETFGLKR